MKKKQKEEKEERVGKKKKKKTRKRGEEVGVSGGRGFSFRWWFGFEKWQ